MPDQNSGVNAAQREQSKQLVRAERILDAAATLVERWGYNKTTIDDIARQSGVAHRERARILGDSMMRVQEARSDQPPR